MTENPVAESRTIEPSALVFVRRLLNRHQKVPAGSNLAGVIMAKYGHSLRRYEFPVLTFRQFGQTFQEDERVVKPFRSEEKTVENMAAGRDPVSRLPLVHADQPGPAQVHRLFRKAISPGLPATGMQRFESPRLESPRVATSMLPLEKPEEKFSPIGESSSSRPLATEPRGLEGGIRLEVQAENAFLAPLRTMAEKPAFFRVPFWVMNTPSATKKILVRHDPVLLHHFHGTVGSLSKSRMPPASSGSEALRPFHVFDGRESGSTYPIFFRSISSVIPGYHVPIPTVLPLRFDRELDRQPEGISRETGRAADSIALRDVSFEFVRGDTRSELKTATFPEVSGPKPAFDVLHPSLDLTLRTPQTMVSFPSEIFTERMLEAPRPTEVSKQSVTTGRVESAQKQLSVPEIADRVYRMLERRLVIEKERRGIY